MREWDWFTIGAGLPCSQLTGIELARSNTGRLGVRTLALWYVRDPHRWPQAAIRNKDKAESRWVNSSLSYIELD